MAPPRNTEPLYTDSRTDEAGSSPNDSARTVSGTYNKQYQPRGVSERAGMAEKIEETNEALIAELEREATRQARSASVRNTAQNFSQAAPKAGPSGRSTTGALSRHGNTWIFYGHGYLYLFVQLPLVVASIVFFGIGVGIESTWLGRQLSAVASAANWVTSLFGANFSLLGPQNLFLTFHTLQFALMLLALMATVVYYLSAGQQPFSGRAVSAKYGTFLLAIIGYSTPIANLIPWVFFYLVVITTLQAKSAAAVFTKRS